MADPLIQNPTTSGNTLEASAAVAYPAYNTGDLVLIGYTADSSSTITAPTAPNGETVVEVQQGNSNTATRAALWYFIATSTEIAGTVTVVNSSARDWSAIVGRVPSGDFNAAAPLVDSDIFAGVAITATVPAMTAGAAGGQVAIFKGVDVTGSTTAPTGWTTGADLDTGDAAAMLFTRDAATTLNEAVAAQDVPNGTNRNQVLIGFIIEPSAGTPIEADSLRFVAQPQNTTVGDAMTAFSVEAYDAVEGARDTGFSGTVDIVPDGTLSGTFDGLFSVAFASGVATFSAVEALSLGDYTFIASATGLGTVESSQFTVSVPTAGATTTTTQAEPMASPVLRNAATASKRRVYMLLQNDDGTPWSGSVSGVKPTVDGVAGTDDIVRVGGLLHYAQLTQAESNSTDPAISVVLAGSGTRLPSAAVGVVTPNDWTTDAATPSEINTAVEGGQVGTDTAALIASLATVDTNVDAIKVITDALTLSGIADAVLDEAVEGSFTVRQYLRVIASVLLAKVSGMENNTPVFRDVPDTKDRLTATTTADGNRTTITLDVS